MSNSNSDTEKIISTINEKVYLPLLYQKLSKITINRMVVNVSKKQGELKISNKNKFHKPIIRIIE